MTAIEVPIEEVPFRHADGVAHFLLNQGRLACSGKPAMLNGGIEINASALTTTQRASIDAREAWCLFAAGGQKWTFELIDLDLNPGGDGPPFLTARLPGSARLLPSRKAERFAITPGMAKIQFSGGMPHALVNLSHGGCACRLPASQAASLPLGVAIDAHFSAGTRLSLTARVEIVRVHYDLASIESAQAEVSCRFMSANMEDFVHAIASAAGQPPNAIT